MKVIQNIIGGLAGAGGFNILHQVVKQFDHEAPRVDLYHGAAHGLSAGIGALTLTEPLGLSDAPVTRTNKSKLLTMAWYTFGGLVTGAVIQTLRK